ncbi:hypothetical protein C8R47DRAFT_103114 [Mycena vitilis]|nr:hypothetical protein C8R47DRAFT_103114 [Mycena vitilis]
MAALRDPSVDSDVDELDMDTPVQLQPPAGESVWKKAPTKIVTPNASAGPSVSKKPPAKKAAPRKPRKASASFESERIDRLEAELSALRDVVYGGPNTAVDAEMAAFEASFISEVYARRLPPGALPVRRWFRAAVPVNTRCHLLWDDNSPKLTVSFSDAAPGAAHALELDLREMVSVNYTDPDDTRNHPVVALRGAQGKTQMQITLGLDACDADWSGTRYSELVAWFQTQLGEINGVDVFCCRYYVTQSMWATAVREANEEEHAPEALKHPIDSAHPQKIFGVTFGPKSHLQLDPTTKYLPVKAWYLRRRLSQVEEAYLVWPVSGQVCIVSGAGDNCAGRVEELDIETTECAWFVDPKETHADKIFVLQTAELEPAGASTSSSTGAEGQTMIKFNSASAKWANSTYDVFVSWIKGKVDRYAVFLGKIGDVRVFGRANMCI